MYIKNDTSNWYIYYYYDFETTVKSSRFRLRWIWVRLEYSVKSPCKCKCARTRIYCHPLSFPVSLPPLLSHSSPFVCARAHASRMRGIIITVSTCKYVFVVTPEVSHPRRGKRARRPRLRRHGVGCHGGGTLGGGSLLPESRFSALAHRGVSWPERKRVTRKRRVKYSLIRTPCAEDNRARSRVNYPRTRFAVGRDSTRQVSLCRGGLYN